MRSVFAKYFIQDILNSVSETAYPDSASEALRIDAQVCQQRRRL